MKIFHLCLIASVLSACGDDDGGPFVPSPDMAMPGVVPVGGDCPEPTGPGTMHGGELDSDETWTAAGSPHLVTSDVVVRRGHTLTLEECALVRVRGASSIVIGANLPSDGTGTLVAHGSYQAETATSPEIIRPVAITSEDEVAHWGSLIVGATGFADLQVFALDHGGNPSQFQGGGGALLMRGDDRRVELVRNVKAVLVLVTNSATYGVNVRGSAAFTADSAGLIINGAGTQGAVSGGEDTRYAMYIEAPGIQSIPSETVINGNARDEIMAHAPFTLDVDERFPAVPVPYQLRNSFYMVPSTAGRLLTLTLDPGVTLKLGGPLAANPSLKLGSNGGGMSYPVKLVAAGTSQRPIHITSGAAAPAPGDWGTIDWQGGPATGNVMTNVTVEYGGGESTTNGFGCGPGDNDSLLLITGWRPDDAFIQGCTFAHSPAGGIVSGWNSDAAGPDLKTGNTFSDIAGACQVSQPKNLAGMCPGNDSTPDCY